MHDSHCDTVIRHSGAWALGQGRRLIASLRHGTGSPSRGEFHNRNQHFCYKIKPITTTSDMLSDISTENQGEKDGIETRSLDS